MTTETDGKIDQFDWKTNFDTLAPTGLSKKVPFYFLEHGIGPPDIAKNSVSVQWFPKIEQS